MTSIRDPISHLDFTFSVLNFSSSTPPPPPVMPSRKSDSSETKAESRRSSLRRLSSIASFHTLNPFNRRRSNNNVTGTPSSASNASLSSSTLASPPENAKVQDFNSSQVFTEHDNIEAVPPPPAQTQTQHPSRRSSYICLPDDPIGGMPRSRTFSNLPVPTRAKKSSNPLVQSKSHARLPSSLLSASRVPSPSASTRKHSTRLTAVENLPRGKKLSRSDTEPLLHAAYEQSPGYHRSTAFKENISLSPIKPLSRMDMLDSDTFYSSSPPSRTYQSRQHARSQSRDALQQFSSPANTLSSSTLSLPKYEQLPAGAYKRLSQKYESSPAYRSARERAPTPGKPVQRWNSQPVLTNKSNHVSPHGEIKQTRLMSAKQAPTPPPAKTPSGDLILEQPKSRTDESQPGHVRQVSEQTPIAQVPSVPSRSRAQTLEPTAGSVFRAEPLAYWTGRFSSLNDRYRNQDLLASLNLGPESPTTTSSPFTQTTDKSKCETDKMHTPAANTARMRRAVEHLYYQCGNDEARESFLKWQKQLAVALSLPELARPVVARGCALEMSLREDSPQTGSSPGMPLSAGRKISFMDRLLGRRQKSLASSG